MIPYVALPYVALITKRTPGSFLCCSDYVLCRSHYYMSLSLLYYTTIVSKSAKVSS